MFFKQLLNRHKKPRIDRNPYMQFQYLAAADEPKAATYFILVHLEPHVRPARFFHKYKLMATHRLDSLNQYICIGDDTCYEYLEQLPEVAKVERKGFSASTKG